MNYQPITPTNFRAGGIWHNPGHSEAVAALVLAFFFPILGLILGLLSLGRSRRMGWPGERMAKAAVWLSVFSIVGGIVSWWFINQHGGYIPVLRNLWWV